MSTRRNRCVQTEIHPSVKTFIVLLAAVALLLLAGAVILRAMSLHVYDGFETVELSRARWSQSRFEPGAVVSEEQVVRAGKASARDHRASPGIATNRASRGARRPSAQS